MNLNTTHLNATNVNAVIFEGNLTDVPKLARVAGGTVTVVETVVLVNRRTQNEAGEWANREPARRRTKGTRVLVVGHTETDAWTDTQTQQKRTTDVVVVDTIGASLRFATVTLRSDASTREEAI